MPKSYQLWVIIETVQVKKMQKSKSKNYSWFVDTCKETQLTDMNQVQLSPMGSNY